MNLWKRYLAWAYPPLRSDTAAVATFGKPSACIFCTSRPTFQVFDENGIKAAFVCDEHVGPLATTWTTSDELVLVRL